MSVWENIYKNPKARAALNKEGSTTLAMPDVQLPRRSGQLPSITIGLAVGTTYTKRTFSCQIGAESTPWTPEKNQGKSELSAFRIEKIISDQDFEMTMGEEALNNFTGDRSEPACTLFLQPLRYLLLGGRPPAYISLYENQKVIHQSPTNEELYKSYVKAQFQYLYDTACKTHTQIPRFQLGQVIVEYPDYFTTADLKKFRQMMMEAAQEFFPPILSQEEETEDIAEHFTFMPESWVTVMHWVTDYIEPKLTAQESDIKKLLVRQGFLPRTSDPINFLVVTIGATHSRVVRLKVNSVGHLLSAKRVGETVPVGHTYFGRTGFGGDHISCAFLEEEEERRYGGTPASRVATLSRKVLEDWGKIGSPEGKKHFEQLYGEQYSKATDKLGEIVLKGFGESPENTIIILGGKIFGIPYFRDGFRAHLQQHRVPGARIVGLSSDENSIDRACAVIQQHQKGLGRTFVFRSGDSDGAPKFTWKIGKVVEGTMVEAIMQPDNKEWDSDHPREFTVTLEKGVKMLKLGYQKTIGGLSQLWANVTLKTRVMATIQVTFRTDGPDDLRITEVKSDAKTPVTADDFQIDMLIAGEHPSQFPIYDKIFKTS